MDKRKTIESVVETGLCTGCGTCVGVCPFDAVRMDIDQRKWIYLPKVEKAKCTECGLCLEACPGHSVDFKSLNREIFGKEPDDILIGSYLNCYIGHATDYNIRYNSSSGGLVTAILIFALEEGLIDGALVTRMSEENPLEPQPFIARTREEIITASKSKYCPVPANIALKEILQNEGKFAVVGLPCHLHGIRKAEQLNSKLKERIVLHLGIFCSHTPNFWGTELLLKRLKIESDEIIKLDYRGEGWPGYMKISRKNGDILLLLLPDYWSFIGSYFFVPTRCLMCSDQTAELADISLGDAWLQEFKSDKVGQSIIISRTELGERFLQKSTARGVIELTHTTVRKVIQSQQQSLYFKKKNLSARVKLFCKKPFINANLLKPDCVDYLIALFPYFNRLVSQNRALSILLKHVPPKLLSIYNIPFNKACSRKVQRDLSNVVELTSRTKPVKIIITNYGSKFNRGDAALLNSRVSAIRQLIPDAEFTVFTYHPEVKNELLDVKTLEVIGRVSLSKKTLLIKKTWQTIGRLVKCSLWQVLQRYFRWDLKTLRNEKGLDEYYNADVIISTGGDVLTEDYGTFSFFSYVVNFLFALLLEKPVVLYAESIGPFKRWWNRALAKFLLNRVKLITLREEISLKHLKELGIRKTPIYITADSAFLLEPAPTERVKKILEKEGIKENTRPLIGFSVSKIVSRYGFDDLNDPVKKYRKYIEVTARVVDYLVDSLNATVIFIPHVNDDRTVADDIINLLENKRKIVSIKNEYTTEETKGIIGQCDLFIGARMHATIASTSMYVPTVAIAYSHKTHGIIGEMLGYERYVIDIKNFDCDTLLSAIYDAWNNREKIREELQYKMEEVKQRALLNAKLVKELLEREKKARKE